MRCDSCRALSIALSVLFGSCGGDTATSSAVPDAGADAAAVPKLMGDDWAHVRATTGILETIAGKGATDRRGTVEWQAQFEGGPATLAELSRPHFAMADRAGNVYIADKEAHAIRKVSPAGIITTVAGTNVPGDDGDAEGPAGQRRLNDPNGIYAMPDGTVYIVDTGNHKIRKVTPQGLMTTVLTAPDGLGTGRGLYVESDESAVYFADGARVMQWRREGATISVFSSGYGGLGNLARDERGTTWQLLVADRGTSRVYSVGRTSSDASAGAPRVVVGGNGQLVRATQFDLPAAQTPLFGVRAVWPHPEGGLLVGTHEGCQVLYIDRSGLAHLYLDGARNAHSGDGAAFDSPGAKLSELRSISVDYQGNVIIVESDAGFVRRIRRK